MPDMARPLERLHVDVKFLPSWRDPLRRDPSIRAIRVLSMVDEGSRKHVAVRLGGGESAARIRQAYRMHWQQPHVGEHLTTKCYRLRLLNNLYF